MGMHEGNDLPSPLRGRGAHDLVLGSRDLEWRSLDELGAAAWWVGAFSEGRQAIERLIAEGNVPESERARIEANMRYYLEPSGQGESNR